MIRSMTAYGRSEKLIDGKDITVEIKSVNGRYFDCNVRVPKMYGFLEEKVKSFLQTNGVSRGKVDVYIGIDILETVGAEIHLDEAYTKSYIDALCKLRDLYKIKDDITVMSISQNRDIFNIIKPEENLEKDWLQMLPVLEEALKQFDEMRETEGLNLKNDILLKRDRLVEMTEIIGKRSPECVETYRTRLEQRLRQVLADYDVELDSSRILTECAVFSDKIAIDEELVRLSSHFTALSKAMEANEPVGRKLDFLLQEINREVNTIGSKANDLEITGVVVDLKSELEKIREQIQNIE